MHYLSAFGAGSEAKADAETVDRIHCGDRQPESTRSRNARLAGDHGSIVHGMEPIRSGTTFLQEGKLLAQMVGGVFVTRLSLAIFTDDADRSPANQSRWSGRRVGKSGRATPGL